MASTIRASDIIKTAESTSGIYLMGGTGPAVWDCSGFVGHCVGAPFGTRYFATGSEGDRLSSHGFTDMRHAVDFSTGAGMKKGDILVWNKPKSDGLYANGHTEIYWGDGTTWGASGPKGGPCGAARGARPVSYTPWQQCWRAKGGVALIKWEESSK